jgi:hypothetical protein
MLVILQRDTLIMLWLSYFEKALKISAQILVIVLDLLYSIYGVKDSDLPLLIGLTIKLDTPSPFLLTLAIKLILPNMVG